MDLYWPFRLMAARVGTQHFSSYMHSQSTCGFIPQNILYGNILIFLCRIWFFTKFIMCIVDTQNQFDSSALCCRVRGPSFKILLYLLVTELCSGVYGEVVLWIIPCSQHMFSNLFPVYCPPLFVLILFTSIFFCFFIHELYVLNEFVTVVHSLFLRKSILHSRSCDQSR